MNPRRSNRSAGGAIRSAVAFEMLESRWLMSAYHHH